MSTHTPGPWRADGLRVWRMIYEVATVNAGAIEPDEVALANAHLIAAAPDLLAALEMMLFYESHSPRPDDYHNGRSRWGEILIDARAAIAKATQD